MDVLGERGKLSELPERRGQTEENFSTSQKPGHQEMVDWSVRAATCRTEKAGLE